MTLKEFIKEVKYGGFTDYDGYGVYATKKGYNPNMILLSYNLGITNKPKELC